MMRDGRKALGGLSHASSRVLLAELAPVAAAVALAAVEDSLSQLYNLAGDFEAARSRRSHTPHHACYLLSLLLRQQLLDFKCDQGDHSSNLCSRPIDWSKHAAVYAGAWQKQRQSRKILGAIEAWRRVAWAYATGKASVKPCVT